MTTATAQSFDIIGSLNSVVKWVVLQILYLIAAFVIMLSAPIIFTVGMQFVAYKFAASASSWAIVYLVIAPLFCAAWMAPIARWYETVAKWKARKMGGHIKVSRTEFVYRIGRGCVWMVIGFFGSLLAEGIFTYAAHRMGMIPHHLNLYFALAPFAVFAPCELVVISRMLRSNDIS